MVYTAKLASLGILFGMSIISGLILPLIVLRVLAKKCQSLLFQRVIGLLNSFAGGVFLSTTLLTLLPEAREAMEEVTSIEFPCTELLMAGGFLVILFIESLVTMVYTKYSKNSQTSKLDKGDFNLQAKTDDKQSEPITTISFKVRDGITNQDYPTNGQIMTTESQNEHCDNSDLSHDGHVHPTSLTNLRNVFLLTALSIHMVFDGLEVALMDTDSAVWSVLVAVTVHKILIFFSIGLSICESNSTLRFVIAMIYMSLVSPIGIGIGIAIISQGEHVAMATVSAVLQGFAVGTFFYVAIFEILTKEFRVSFDIHRIYKAFATVIGCALFAVVKYVTDL